MLLCRPVRGAEDLVNLQSDIDKISHWTREKLSYPEHCQVQEHVHNQKEMLLTLK